MIIYKYNLSIHSYQTLELPSGYKILKVDKQGNELQLWAFVDEDELNISELSIRVIGTGHRVDRNDDNYSNLKHLNTVVMDDGFVWHVFEVV